MTLALNERDPTTWKRNQHESQLDLVWTRGTITTVPPPRIWTGSDHAMIHTTITAQHPETRLYQTIDWDKWTSYLNNEDPNWTPTTTGEAYDIVARLSKTFVVQKHASIHSKKWWNKELSQQKTKVRQASPQDYHN